MLWRGMAIDVLAKVEAALALVALAFALAGLHWPRLEIVALPFLLLLAVLVVVSASLFAWEKFAHWRDLKAKGGGKMELRHGTPRTFRRTGPKLSPNAPCHCGSGAKLKRCCREQPPEGLQLANGMRLVNSELRKTS